MSTRESTIRTTLLASTIRQTLLGDSGGPPAPPGDPVMDVELAAGSVTAKVELAAGEVSFNIELTGA